ACALSQWRQLSLQYLRSSFTLPLRELGQTDVLGAMPPFESFLCSQPAARHVAQLTVVMAPSNRKSSARLDKLMLALKQFCSARWRLHRIHRRRIYGDNRLQ